MASKPISIRFPESEYESIIKRAEQDGVTPSDVVRDGFRTSQDNEYLIRILVQKLSMMESSVLTGLKKELKNFRVKIEE